jgi:hypothetical protein
VVVDKLPQLAGYERGGGRHLENQRRALLLRKEKEGPVRDIDPKNSTIRATKGCKRVDLRGQMA